MNINTIKERWKKMFNKIKSQNNREIIPNEIDYEELKDKMQKDSTIDLIDVRSPQEYAESHLAKAMNIPLYELATEAREKFTNKEQTLIVYCQSGNRSKHAMEILERLGYQNVYALKDGLDGI